MVGAFFMIDIDNISVSYRMGEESIPALSSLSLKIRRGEYVAVLGPNGSGKSTLIKAICGLLKTDSGRIILLDKTVRLGGFGDEYFGRVGVVLQEPEGQFLMRDVRIEILSVLQNLGLSHQMQQERLESIIERFNLADILNQKPESLSGGQMQIVNLACALAVEPEILLLDEPTTFLDRYYQQLLLDHLDKLHQAGLAILHITQYPDEAARAERICVLDKGRLALDCQSSEIADKYESLSERGLSPSTKSRFMNLFGFDWNDSSSRNTYCSKLRAIEGLDALKEISDSERSEGHVITINDLHFRYPDSEFTLEIDKLKLSRGEIVGLLGATGSGKSTLTFLLSGLINPDFGSIEYKGKPLSSYAMRDLRSKIGITWQLPDLAMLGPTVKDDINFALDNFGLGNIDIASILNQVGLCGFENRIVDTLSGGEKRKLSIAGILASGPEYLILDEPSAFLDPQSQAELVSAIAGLAKEGRGILIAGHDLYFISQLANRIIGLKSGRIVCDVSTLEFFSNQKYLRAIDLPSDPLTAFRQTLAEHGFRLPFGSLEPEKIKSYLAKFE
jgi:energy-coupling factor transport system ATP-binding protein